MCQNEYAIPDGKRRKPIDTGKKGSETASRRRF
jgi:hypothetical protein